MGQVVSVYGSSAPQPGEDGYELAHRLGRELAGAGYTVMTGGYAGTMEAVSRGAHEAGGHVIGVTARLFDAMGHEANSYIDEEIAYDTLAERLLHLVTRSDAAVALPGGVGTLSEVALTWSLLQTGEITPRPFVLLGEWWDAWMRAYYGEGQYIREQHLHLFQVARTPQQAVTMLRNWT
jgi:uncharacterized protein (TIGR00730 family)